MKVAPETRRAEIERQKAEIRRWIAEVEAGKFKTGSRSYPEGELIDTTQDTLALYRRMIKNLDLTLATPDPPGAA